MVPGELVQAVRLEPRFGPLISLPGTQITAPLLDQKPFEPPRDVPVDLSELVGGVAGAKVVAPPAQDRVEHRDHIADVDADPVAPGAFTDPDPYPGHGRLAGPAVQVITHDARCSHNRPDMRARK